MGWIFIGCRIAVWEDREDRTFIYTVFLCEFWIKSNAEKFDFGYNGDWDILGSQGRVRDIEISQWEDHYCWFNQWDREVTMCDDTMKLETLKQG